MARKPIILWVSDSPRASTSFGRASREILTRLTATNEFEVICYANFDTLILNSSMVFPFQVIPGDNAGGRESLQRVIKLLRPEVVVTCGDPWMTGWFADAPERADVRWVNCCRFYGAGSERVFGNEVFRADSVVVCTEYAQFMFATAFPQKRVALIPFGVDGGVFQPLSTRDEIREAHDLTSKFVVGVVARNTLRKNLPQLISAFSRFAELRDDAVLYLHTQSMSDEGSDLNELLCRYHLEDKCGMSRGKTAFEGVDDNTLCRIYNIFDIFVLPSMAEGSGLAVLEAMSCGVPVVTSGSPPLPELVCGAGELIRTNSMLYAGQHGIECSVVDSEHTVELMEKLYEASYLRTEYGRVGRMVSKHKTWDRSAVRWARLLNDVATTDCR